MTKLLVADQRRRAFDRVQVDGTLLPTSAELSTCFQVFSLGAVREPESAWFEFGLSDLTLEEFFPVALVGKDMPCQQAGKGFGVFYRTGGFASHMAYNVSGFVLLMHEGDVLL